MDLFRRRGARPLEGGSGPRLWRGRCGKLFSGVRLHVESQAGVAWVDATIGDGEGGGLMGSERQQGRMARRGDEGRAEAPSCFLGPELPTESRAFRARRLRGMVDTDQSGWIDELDRLASGTGLQAAIESRGAAPGQGAAPWAPSPEFRADVANGGKKTKRGPVGQYRRRWNGTVVGWDRRRQPTTGVGDGGRWRLLAHGAQQLQAAPGSRGPAGHSEGRGPRRGRELAGVAGGDDRRKGPTATTDGAGRRR